MTSIIICFPYKAYTTKHIERNIRKFKYIYLMWVNYKKEMGLV